MEGSSGISLPRNATRRSVLGKLSVFFFTGLSGCVFSEKDAGVASYGLLVSNYDDDRHELAVSISFEDTEVYSKSFQLSSGKRINKDQVFSSKGSYTIHAELADGTTETGELTVGKQSNAPVTDYHVRILEGGTLSLYLPAP